jgi:hypothetical protein
MVFNTKAFHYYQIRDLVKLKNTPVPDLRPRARGDKSQGA